MGAPFGNRNAGKERLIEAAFRRHFAPLKSPQDADYIAKAMVEKAKAGDVAAAVFVRDSVDGKPMRRIDVEGVDQALNLIASEELRAAVRKRMEPFFRTAVSSLVGGGEPGPGGNTRIN